MEVYCQKANIVLSEAMEKPYRLLSRMQHFGCPTRLLDWSSNPLTALWFACNGNAESDAIVYMTYPTRKTVVDDADEDLPTGGEIVFFEPPAFDARVEAQSSVFSVHGFLWRALMSDMKTYDFREDVKQQGPCLEIIVEAKFKQDILAALNSFGVNQMRLFPEEVSIGSWLSDALRSGETTHYFDL